MRTLWPIDGPLAPAVWRERHTRGRSWSFVFAFSILASVSKPPTTLPKTAEGTPYATNRQNVLGVFQDCLGLLWLAMLAGTKETRAKGNEQLCGLQPPIKPKIRVRQPLPTFRRSKRSGTLVCFLSRCFALLYVT